MEILVMEENNWNKILFQGLKSRIHTAKLSQCYTDQIATS